MLKRLLPTVLLGLSLTLLPGCLAGPNRLTRSWDDWVNQKYTENAWLHGALLSNVVPIYPLVGGALSYVDVLFVNTYYFWAQDAWDNRGTGFEHRNPENAARTLAGAF